MGGRLNWRSFQKSIFTNANPGICQDSYALCRIFNKTSPSPKMIEHKGAHYEANSQWAAAASVQSPAGNFSSDGIGEDLENSSYSPYEPTHAFDMMQGGSFHGATAESDDKWMQFLNEEVLNPMASCYHDPVGFSTFPSKVDVALECARLQHRLSLPPLMTDDFPQFNLPDHKALHDSTPHQEIKGVDVIQEILSVASSSQEMINNFGYDDNNVWLGNNYSHSGGFPEFHFGSGVASSSRMSGSENESASLIEIRDLEEEFRQERKQVENLRGIKVLKDDLGEVHIAGEVDRRTCLGDKSYLNNAHNSQLRADDCPVRFIEINPNSQHRDESDDRVRKPSYELLGKVDVSHGLFVSRVCMAKTCFLHSEPSKMVYYHLNPMERETEEVKRFHFHQKVRFRVSKFTSIMTLINDKLKLMTRLCKSSFGNKSRTNAIRGLRNLNLNPHE
ncbi:NAC domain-containing protein 86-like isoform X1 [Carex littledalei]|uniref:NAC domain-containing protein 86-like isoform X1 n=1 Tax=Carex littledalei TaxID=544730 RepID=A0A833V2I9_9POAL|nr:NAC domain-containing protein 86-like isoform X1 [Carex littledalei]